MSRRRQPTTDDVQQLSTPEAGEPKLKKQRPIKTIEQELEQDLQCPICHDVYCEPVTVRCGHTTCKACITGTDNHHKCTICNKTIGDVLSIGVNQTLKNLVVKHFPQEAADALARLERQVARFESIVVAILQEKVLLCKYDLYWALNEEVRKQNLVPPARSAHPLLADDEGPLKMPKTDLAFYYFQRMLDGTKVLATLGEPHHFYLRPTSANDLDRLAQEYATKVAQHPTKRDLLRYACNWNKIVTAFHQSTCQDSAERGPSSLKRLCDTIWTPTRLDDENLLPFGCCRPRPVCKHGIYEDDDDDDDE